MVRVSGALELTREAEGISDLASYIFDRLRLMETNHPYLKDAYAEYKGLRNRIEQASINPPENKTALGTLFDKLRECLHHISDEINSQISASGKSRGMLIPPNYLPMSFDLLLEDFAESSLHAGTISPLSDATEDLLFGEMGVEEVPHHRAAIKKRILKALVCDYGRAAEIRDDLSEYGDEVFKLLKLPNDKLESLREAQDVEPLEAAVALIILKTRAQISHKRGMRHLAHVYKEPAEAV